ATGAILLRSRLPGRTSASCSRACPCEGGGHGHQAPLAAHLVEAAQQELAEPKHRLDDPEHRLGRLLAQGVALLALFRLETMAHRCNWRWVLRQRRVFRETFSQRG